MLADYRRYYEQGVKIASEFTKLLSGIAVPATIGAAGGSLLAEDPWHGAAMGALVGGAGGLGREIAVRRALGGAARDASTAVKKQIEHARNAHTHSFDRLINDSLKPTNSINEGAILKTTP